MRTSRAAYLRIALLALGTFAIGTEDLLIAGILDLIASDLSVSVAATGQLVTVFALTFALTSPVLIALTNRVRRNRLLMGALFLFAMANLMAALAQSYALLLAARILAAMSGGVYAPVATAAAARLVAPSQRGTAIGLVTTGFSVALVLGVPLGTWVGHHVAWQMAFVLIAGLSVVSTVGLTYLLPEIAPAPVVTPRERFTLLTNRRVLAALALTALVFGSAATLYTYIAPVLEHIAPRAEVGLAGMLLLMGCASTAGNILGGTATDRWGSARIITGSVLLLAGATASFSVLMVASALAYPAVAAGVMIVVFGVAWYAFVPPMNHRLIALAPAQSSLILALMGTALFLGIALGAATGGLLVDAGHLTTLGWIASAFALLAIGLNVLTSRKPKQHQTSEAVPSARSSPHPPTKS